MPPSGRAAPCLAPAAAATSVRAGRHGTNSLPGRSSTATPRRGSSSRAGASTPTRRAPLIPGPSAANSGGRAGAGSAIRSRFAGDPNDSSKTRRAPGLKLDHFTGAGHLALPPMGQGRAHSRRAAPWPLSACPPRRDVSIRRRPPSCSELVLCWLPFPRQKVRHL